MILKFSKFSGSSLNFETHYVSICGQVAFKIYNSLPDMLCDYMANKHHEEKVQVLRADAIGECWLIRIPHEGYWKTIYSVQLIYGKFMIPRANYDCKVSSQTSNI